MRRSLVIQLIMALALPLCMLSALLGGCGNEQSDQRGVADAMSDGPNTYIGPVACGSCHAEAYQDWKQSDHYKAMMLPTDSNVLGDFDDASFTADGVTSQFFRRDGKYIIRTEGVDGEQQDFEVLYTFGYAPLQQYLVEAPGGRMQVPRVSWDTQKGVWFHQYEGQRIPHGDWLHWTGAAQNWNNMCASCHSTDLKRAYNEETDTYHSTWEELTVTCESCHGPGGHHATFMGSDEYAAGERVAGSYLLGHKGLSNVEQMSTCVRCHARRAEFSDEPTASLQTLDNYLPALPVADLYFADGQMRDEVYTHGSFAQSKMFRRGVRCTDCHQPHTGKLLLPGNTLCRQCHDASYDSEEHTFHAAATGATECISCHMPTRTYMGNDVRHDHSFRVPRPDQSVAYGTPNACTGCHTERSDQWAADAVVHWYGKERPPHFSDKLLAGQQGTPQVLAALLEVLTDTATPAIIRASALHYMNDLPGEQSFEALLRALKDPDAQVRHQAVGGISIFPAEHWITPVMPLLRDAVLAVRMEAASVLSVLPAEAFDRGKAPGFAKAESELMSFLHYQSDMVTGSLMLADHSLRTGDVEAAERYYLRTLRMDGQANYARLNLASMYNANGRNDDALTTLREALSLDGTNPRIHYNLALLLAEMGKPDEAFSHFEDAEMLDMESDRLYVNHAALLQQQKRSAEAERVLSKGLSRFPRSADLLAEAMGLSLRSGRDREASAFLDRLRMVAPDDPRIAQAKAYLQQVP